MNVDVPSIVDEAPAIYLEARGRGKERHGVERTRQRDNKR
jgi:hypothetical protein